LFYSKLKNIPLLASYHTHLPEYLQHYGLGMLEGLLWELLKAGHNQAQLNLCTSTAMMQALTDHGIERVDLWQRGVDTETFQPHLANQEMRSRLTQGHPEAPLLLYVGRLSVEKEIEQIKPVMDSIPGARLALVGDGPHRRIWRSTLPERLLILWATCKGKISALPLLPPMPLCFRLGLKLWVWCCWRRWRRVAQWWRLDRAAFLTLWRMA
jgi:glycosyltransferase involved in cell wall biosynthesis